MDNSDHSEIAQNSNNDLSGEEMNNVPDDLRKFLKMQLVYNEIKELAFMYDGNKNPNVKKALQKLSVMDCLNIGDKDSDSGLLGLPSLAQSEELSFADQEEFSNLVIQSLTKRLEPIIEYGKFMEKEAPGIFGKKPIFKNENIVLDESLDNFDMMPKQKEFLDLFKQKQDAEKNLFEMKQMKCGLMKEVLENKYGSDMINEMQLLEKKAYSTKMTASVLERFFAKNWLDVYGENKNDALKAIKEVEGYLDEELFKEQLTKK